MCKKQRKSEELLPLGPPGDLYEIINCKNQKIHEQNCIINSLEERLALAEDNISQLRSMLERIKTYRNNQADMRTKLVHSIKQANCFLNNIIREEDIQDHTFDEVFNTIECLDSSSLSRINPDNQIILQRIEGLNLQNKVVQIFRIFVNGFDAHGPRTGTYFFKWELEFCLLQGDKQFEKQMQNRMKKFVERKREAFTLNWKEIEEGISNGHKDAEYSDVAAEDVLKKIKDCLNVSNRGVILLPEELTKEILGAALEKQNDELTDENHQRNSKLENDASDFHWLFRKCDGLLFNSWARIDGS